MKIQIQKWFILFLPLICSSFLWLIHPSSSTGFDCTGAPTKCQAILGFKTTNSTTYSSLVELFQVDSLLSLFGANNLPLNTSSNLRVPGNTTVRIPFPCSCANGTGFSDKGRTTYTVKKKDYIYTIAFEDIFGGFVTFKEVAQLNGKGYDDKQLEVGEKLWIPFPCSCDAVAGVEVVHYVHKAAKGSFVAEIAAEFDTSEVMLMQLNGIYDPDDLGRFKSWHFHYVLDVPLRACSSSIWHGSSDHDLLVPSGSYALTANDCIQCSCSASTYQLSCTSINVTNDNSSRICPPATCTCGNMTVGVGDDLPEWACGAASTCVYAGFNDSAIFTKISASREDFRRLPALSSSTSACNSIAMLGCQQFGRMELAVLMIIIIYVYF